MPRFLIDLSAWARSSHPEVHARWARLVEGDQLVCHPVFALELLHNATSATEYRRLFADIDVAFDWLRPDAETAPIALRLQQTMASSAPTGQRVKTADLLIAALAVQHDVGVLHYDADYDRIGSGGGEHFVSEWIAPRGSLESGSATAVSARKAFRQAFGARMVQLAGDADLEVWPELLAWLDQQLQARGIGAPPPPR